MAQLPLSGKVAIVTGASRGIGAAIALELASKGAKVVITYTSPSSAPLVSALITHITSLPHTPSAISIRCDLRLPSAAAEIISTTLSAFGPHIDILINNAGCTATTPLASFHPSEFNSVYALNVLAPLFLTQAILGHLRSPGRIVNISSVGARAGFANLSLYCSSKAALEGLTRCCAAELGPQGHTVNAVAPGPVEGDMIAEVPESVVAMQKAQTPVGGRLGTAEEVARVVGWLAEEGSGWVSGQVVSASGGWAMY